ncbi:MAG: ankyrin repeat domain-containing protein [Planctomycetales bacterium]|nr:ankyrin repeat domain-containing protein [Planctomycetales bacterium]
MPTRTTPQALLTISAAALWMCISTIGCSSSKPDPQGQVAVGGESDNAQNDSAPGTDDKSDAEDKATPMYSTEAFLAAARDGKYRVVEVCLDSAMDVNSTDPQGLTPLAMAAYNAHVDIIKLLLKNNATVDSVDRMGMTPLIHAASCPEKTAPEACKILIDAGADIAAVGGEENWTALMMAAAEGNLEVVEMLLSNGANKDTVDTDGESAADFAVEKGHFEIVKLLESK